MRLFAAAREAAGRAADEFDAPDVATLLDQARTRYGEPFAAVLSGSRVWVNGDEPPLGGATELRDGDEVAVLPPVSGGSAAPGDHGYVNRRARSKRSATSGQFTISQNAFTQSAFPLRYCR